MMLRAWLNGAFCCLLPICVVGCVSIPPERVSREIEAEELSDHVHFLAQRPLRGRKPMMLGSRFAQKYIASRFTACGLEPWGRAKSYAQPFAIGTNMIGVLPGSDPNLADEMLIISAHYDHLGKTEDGLCLGACDNASGVAALLEIAEYLALSPKRPARSICFAAFDQEENALLGAFAFSRRFDFDPSKIAGVINVDLLGRDGFEVLDHHLFVAGTAGFRPVRDAMTQVCSDLDILPVGMDLVGARGDHVAFEDLGICTLFFTCGPYRDYHKPGDTPEKIDYRQIVSSSDVILAALEILSESREPLICRPSPRDSTAELRSLKLTLDKVGQDPNALGLAAEQVLSLVSLSQELESCLKTGRWDKQIQRRLVFKYFDTLSLFLTWPEEACDPNEDAKRALQQHMLQWRGGLVNLDFRSELVAIGRAMVDHVSDHSLPLIWGIPNFQYHNVVVHEDYLYLTEIGEDRYALVCTFLDLSFDVKLPGLFQWPPRLRPSSEIGIAWPSKRIEGTRDEILDSCLLDWGDAISEDDPNACWGQVVSHVTGLPNDRTYEQWLQWRLDNGGWSDETQWMISALQSPNPFLARTAIERLPAKPSVELEPVLAGIIDNRQTHPYVRTGCIGKSHRRSTAVMWNALVDAIHDPAPHRGLTYHRLKGHPQRDLMQFMDASRARERELWSKAYPRVKRKTKQDSPPKTVGEFAVRRLKDLTGQDFGQDKQAWRRWLQRHYGLSLDESA